MSEPGKFVRINKVNSSSKAIKKRKNDKSKKVQKNLKKQVQSNNANPTAAKLVKKQTNSQTPQKLSKNAKKKLKKKNQSENNNDKANQKHPKPGQAQAKPKKNKPNANQSEQMGAGKKDFHDDLADRLKASRFRFINEELYTRTGNDALEIFDQDESAFTTYHDGYRKQVECWPLNPLDRIINSVKKLPPHFIVADFGCGEARLSQSVPQKCYSFDLVAANENVIACNMSSTPLSPDSVNVAVFCLSLMGTNLQDFILEANRVLKIGGHLKIAEIESRFENVNQFIKNVSSCGFELISKDISTKVFCFLYFKKVRQIQNTKQVPEFSLKPCLYKKR